MAGLVPDPKAREAAMDVYLGNLAWACEQVKDEAVILVIEPINNRDIPGYFLNYRYDGRAVIEQVGADNLKLQLDLYHCQIMEGDLAVHVRDYNVTAHMQIAGVPHRHEPNVVRSITPTCLTLLMSVATAVGSVVNTTPLVIPRPAWVGSLLIGTANDPRVYC